MSALTLKKGDLAFDETLSAQSIAANPLISIWASANAGAGKTKVLIDRIARLLLGGAQPGRVLAVTYTKAAAAEMQTRLYSKLGDWTIASDEDLREQLLSLDPELDLDRPGTLARARALFAAALETPGGLKIQTIHAFCQTILQRFPLEAGVPPGFQILDDTTASTLSDQAFETAASLQPDAFLKIASLTSQTSDHSIIMAAAKDRDAIAQARNANEPVLERLAASLGLLPEDTPTALRQRAIARLDRRALLEAAGVLETGKVTDKKLAAAIKAVFATTHADEAWAILLGIIWTQKGEVRERPIFTKDMGNSLAVTAALGAYDEWPSGFCDDIAASEDDVRACQIMHHSAALTTAALAYEEAWTNSKRALGTLDFDDLVAATAKLLSGNDGAAQWVLYKLDAGIEHILIDEAQDTNPDQWDLMAPLFAVLEQEARDAPRTRFVVGDEKQSIFSFQGARPDRFALERDRFEKRGETYQDGRKALTFDLSFRTGQTILNAVDATWAKRLPDAPLPLVQTQEIDPPFERKYAFDTRHSAYRNGMTGAVELWPLVLAPEKAPDVKAWDQPIDIERENSARNTLADQIAQELRARLNSGFSVWDEGVNRPMRPSDVMVLVKKRGPFFHQLIRRLKHHKVPVAGADRIKLVEDAAIQDLMALGRFALLPQDDFNTACVLKGAFCGLIDDDKHLFPLAWNRGEDVSLWQRLKETTDPVFADARNFLERTLNKAGHLPPYEFFASLLELPLPGTQKTGWQALTERLGREVREPVEAFLSRALDFGRSGAPTLQAFLSQIETDAADVKREMDQDGSGVRVMTVHGAKGLEAPIVILPDTTSAVRPGDSAISFSQEAAAFFWSPSKDQDTIEFKSKREAVAADEKGEDARLLYVAMTRARDVLILCGHQTGKPSATDPEPMPKDCWYRTLSQSVPLIGESEIMHKEAVSYQFWGQYPPSSDAKTQAKAATPEPLPIWIYAPPPGETPGPRRVAPSALVPDGMEPPALSPLAPDAHKRFLRGRLIHELLQRLPDLAPAKWESAATARLKREADLDEEGRAAIVAETLAVLTDSRFARLFGPGSRAEAAIVGRGPGLPEDMVVNGSVDRLVVTETEVLVLDYKTNRPPPLHVKDVAQVYLNQMAAYRALLQANWPDKHVRCALLWTDGPRLMELPQSALDQALHEIATLTR
jgi:ATP-dependent helicase/nuclease subunit A